MRQLLNVIRNIVVLHDGLLVQPGMLPSEIALATSLSYVTEQVTALNTGWTGPSASTKDRVSALIGTPLADVERELIEATIEYCDGSIPRAARMLELSPSTIYRKLESWTGTQRRAEA